MIVMRRREMVVRRTKAVRSLVRGDPMGPDGDIYEPVKK